MTSRTQLPIEVLPNQTERGTPAPQPQPASPLPVTRLGPQHAFCCAILLRATPRRPNLAPSPELEVHAKQLHQRYRDRFLSHVVAARFHQFCCFCPAVASPSPIQSHSSPAQVQSGLSLSLARALLAQVLSMDGLDLMRDFFLARTPSPPYLAPRSLVAASRPRHHFAR